MSTDTTDLKLLTCRQGETLFGSAGNKYYRLKLDINENPGINRM